MTKRALGLAGFALGAVLAAASPAFAAGGHVEKPPRMEWTFAGPFGFYDDAQLQRGFKVFREVCAACHSMKKLSFRNLAEPGGPGFTEEQVKALAAEYTVQDGPNEAGEMFERPGRPSDRFPSPFPNELAARAANGGAYPLDLSLIAKNRAGGENYVYALLTGYRDNPPPGFVLGDGMYYNDWFAGHQIAMAPPLMADRVTYADGTPATVERMAKDVSTFLAWAASPHLEARNSLGVKVMLFLFIFTGLLYATKRKIWKNLH